MPEIVEPDFSKLGLGQEPVKYTIAHVMRMEQSPHFTTEHPGREILPSLSGCFDLPLRVEVLERLREFA